MLWFQVGCVEQANFVQPQLGLYMACLILSTQGSTDKGAETHGDYCCPEGLRFCAGKWRNGSAGLGKPCSSALNVNVGQLLTCQVLRNTPEERNRPIPHIPKWKGQATSRNCFSSAGRAGFPHNPGTRVKRHDPRCVTSPATVDPLDVGRPPTSLTFQTKTGPASPLGEQHFRFVSLCL